MQLACTQNMGVLVGKEKTKKTTKTPKNPHF